MSIPVFPAILVFSIASEDEIILTNGDGITGRVMKLREGAFHGGIAPP